MKELLDKEFQDHSHEDNIPHIQGVKVLDLIPELYPGGIAIWGALPAVFNSSICPDEDNGVHVHARMVVGGEKQIDETFDEVRVTLTTTSNEKRVFSINGSDTANYNLSTIFKKKLKYLICPKCDKVHSDKDWFAVNYHTIHDCEHCGHIFEDTEPSISNSVMLLKETCGDVLQDRTVIDPVERSINVKKQTFKGGMQIWGSNPAVLWTSPKFEEGGIHFHGFQTRDMMPTVDETYGTLIINSILIDPEMTRHLMAQNGLNYLKNHLTSLSCPSCKQLHFDSFNNGLNPHLTHECEHCGNNFVSDTGMAYVSNPLISILKSF